MRQAWDFGVVSNSDCAPYMPQCFFVAKPQDKVVACRGWLDLTFVLWSLLYHILLFSACICQVLLRARRFCCPMPAAAALGRACCPAAACAADWRAWCAVTVKHCCDKRNAAVRRLIWEVVRFSLTAWGSSSVNVLAQPVECGVWWVWSVEWGVWSV